MDSDRHSKSKRDRDDRKKDRKKKSRSRSSPSRSRSSSSDSSAYTRKKNKKKSSHNDSEKHSSRHRESREEMPHEDEYRKNMMNFHPMMYDKMKMPGFDMGQPMMPMPGMNRGFPSPFPMPGYPMMRPPMYPPGMMPPLPNQMDPMMHKMNRMGMKPFPDHKTAAPMVKKEKDKSAKKDEESGKVLEFAPPVLSAEILRSMHISIKHVQEPLFLASCKKVLQELEGKLRDKKLKSRAKEISEFLDGLHDKIKENEKKDKKKSSTSESSKFTELELLKALKEVEDIKSFLSIVNVEKFGLENCYEPEIIRLTESMESASLFNEARALFTANKTATSEGV